MNVGRRQHQSCSTIDWFPLKARSADGLAADDALIGEEPAKLSRVITDYAEAVASRKGPRHH